MRRRALRGRAGGGGRRGLDATWLEGAVDAAVALLHAGRVPRDVEVEEVGALALEVDAFAGGVGGEEDADGMIGEGAVEGALDVLALLVGHAAVEVEDVLVRAVDV